MNMNDVNEEISSFCFPDRATLSFIIVMLFAMLISRTCSAAERLEVARAEADSLRSQLRASRTQIATLQVQSPVPVMVVLDVVNNGDIASVLDQIRSRAVTTPFMSFRGIVDGEITEMIKGDHIILLDDLIGGRLLSVTYEINDGIIRGTTNSI